MTCKLITRDQNESAYEDQHMATLGGHDEVCLIVYFFSIMFAHHTMWPTSFILVLGCNRFCLWRNLEGPGNRGPYVMTCKRSLTCCSTRVPGWYWCPHMKQGWHYLWFSQIWCNDVTKIVEAINGSTHAKYKGALVDNVVIEHTPHLTWTIMSTWPQWQESNKISNDCRQDSTLVNEFTF